MSQALDFRIPLGEWAETAEDWIQTTLDAPLDLLRQLMLQANDALVWLLHTPPWWLMVLIVAALAWVLKGLTRGWVLAIGAVVGLSIIQGVDQWENAMDTLGLVIVATVIAVAIAVPLGVLAAQFHPVSLVVRPVMDFLQTMPPMVYLIPAIAFFSVGVVPGMVATILFALPPGVRMTELGIRTVNHEVVEAGQAFGARGTRILRQIQLPLALPNIMAGINQIIMLSLSMVVIAGMVGAGGLGGDVVRALSGNDLALGIEAGFSVVIVAMLLDRITAYRGRRQST